MGQTGNRQNNDKGKLLEDIVAEIHKVNGLECEVRVKRPSLLPSGGEREFDVIISASVGPYPTQIPIECKNLSGSVGIELIDAYHAKLQEVGLNVRGAIYVTTKGFEIGGLPPEFEDIIRVEFPLRKVYEEVKIHRRADRWDPA